MAEGIHGVAIFDRYLDFERWYNADLVDKQLSRLPYGALTQEQLPTVHGIWRPVTKPW
jgi:hypothetical protein